MEVFGAVELHPSAADCVFLAGFGGTIFIEQLTHLLTYLLNTRPGLWAK